MNRAVGPRFAGACRVLWRCHRLVWRCAVGAEKFIRINGPSSGPTAQCHANPSGWVPGCRMISKGQRPSVMPVHLPGQRPKAIPAQPIGLGFRDPQKNLKGQRPAISRIARSSPRAWIGPLALDSWGIAGSYGVAIGWYGDAPLARKNSSGPTAQCHTSPAHRAGVQGAPKDLQGPTARPMEPDPGPSPINPTPISRRMKSRMPPGWAGRKPHTNSAGRPIGCISGIP